MITGVSEGGSPAKYSLEFELRGLPNLANISFRGGWRGRFGASKTWKRKVWQACWHLKPERPLERARLTLIRCSTARPDYDGLVTSFKPLIDGLVEVGVIANDKHENIGVPNYDWELAKRNNGKIKVKVEEV